MSGGFTVRRAQPADGPGLEWLGPATFLEAFGAELPADAVAARMAAVYARDRLARDLTDPAQAWFVACAGGAPVGFLALNAAAEPPACVDGDRPVELSRLYVRADWHGRGPGPALMAAGLAEARARAAGVLWLQAWERNPRALAFYQAHGFRRAGVADVVFAGRSLPHLILVCEPGP